MSPTARIAESIIIALLFLSLLVSKVGIYIGLALLLIFQLYTLYSDKQCVSKIKQTLPEFARWSIGLFMLGVLLTLPYKGVFLDLSDYFRKAAILLLFPLLILTLTREYNSKIATAALIVGILVSTSLSLYKFSAIGISQWDGQRISSFWDIGRWGEMLGYCLALLVPFTLERKSNNIQFLTLILLISLTLICLLLSGGRAPLLAVTITLALYLTVRKPKLAVCSLILILLVFAFGQNIHLISEITSRVVSITNLSNNHSNIARLIMWEHGISFSLYNLLNDTTTFAFGAGIHNLESSYTSFLYANSDINLLEVQTSGNFSFNDFHNTYLDIFIRLGPIYAIVFIGLLIALFKKFLKLRSEKPEYAYPGICLITTFCITGMFYTSGLEFQFTVFLTLIALCYANIIKDSTNEQARL